MNQDTGFVPGLLGLSKMLRRLNLATAISSNGYQSRCVTAATDSPDITAQRMVSCRSQSVNTKDAGVFPEKRKIRAFVFRSVIQMKLPVLVWLNRTVSYAYSGIYFENERNSLFCSMLN